VLINLSNIGMIYDIIDINAVDLKGYYMLWLYWRQNIYKNNNEDNVLSNLFLYPYFLSLIDDEFSEMSRCLNHIKNPDLVSQIYYEYRMTDYYYGNFRGNRTHSYFCSTLSYASFINLNLGDYFPFEIEPPPWYMTTKLLKIAIKRDKKIFLNYIHKFVYHYVFTRKVDVMIMKEWKAKLWRNGALTGELQAAVSKREIHP
jgi:hypothetical protein